MTRLLRTVTRGAVLGLISLALESTASATTVVYDGIILDRANKYDACPAHLYISGVHNIWWCSQGNSGDEIWYSSKSGSLGAGGWSTPVKVFGKEYSPWTYQHTCDPSVIKGSFPYNGKTYTYALYYTSARASGGTDNAIGVAFSKTGLNWTAYPTPIITPSGNASGQYGAGTSGVAYSPGTSTIEQAYFDTTLAPSIRLTQGTGGITFAPLPGSATQMSYAGGSADGEGPDIAYYPTDQHWYAVIKDHDPNGIFDGETRILRAYDANSLSGTWQVIGILNSTTTGWQQNHNPGLAKNADSTLYVDGNGWAYAFFTVGNQRPDVGSWAIAQAHFLPQP